MADEGDQKQSLKHPPQDEKVHDVTIANEAAIITDEALRDFGVPQGQLNQAAIAHGDTAVRRATETVGLKRENTQLEELSLTDPLTDLGNRRHLTQRTKEEIARSLRTKKPISALLLDLDRFKEFNDTHGHPAGDELLKKLGKLIASLLRDPDFPARYGGEEFAVLLPGTDLEDAKLVAERIRTAIALQPFTFQVNGQEITQNITTSIGVGEINLGSETPEKDPKKAEEQLNNLAQSLLVKADQALYQAKATGRNRVETYQSPTP